MIRLKKEIVFIVCLIISLFILCFFTSCGENSDHIQSVVTDTTTADTKPEVIKYKVTFDSNGANEIDPQFVEINKRVNEPEIPTRLGYTFDGWYAGSEKWVFLSHIVDNDITLTAKWKPNNNAIIFDANGGIGIMDGMSIATDSSQNLIPNRFTKAGYSFIGWATSEFGSVEYMDGEHYKMGTEESYTLYAKWQANENTIVFNGNGATSGSMSSMIVKTDEVVTLLSNNFAKVGYTFKGWAVAENGIVMYENETSYTMGTDSVYTLYAVWEANQNILKFEADGADGTMPEVIAATGDKFSLPQNEFVKKGYSFKGWSTSANGKVEYEDVTSYTMGANSLYTLYAIWEMDIYQIKYHNLFNVTQLPDNPDDYNVYSNVVFNIPEKENYIFKGWFTDDAFENKITEIESGTTGNLNLYARWEPIEYTITYITEKVTYTRTFIADQLPVKVDDLNSETNYLFGGWYLTADFSGMPVTQIVEVGDIELYARYVMGTEGLNISDGKVIGYTGNSASVIIPDVYKGIPVTSIHYGAFSSSSSIESVIIPDGVIRIETGAFAGCTSLTNVTLPHTLTYIGKSVFQGCCSLESIIIPNSVTTIERFAFYDCPVLVICCEVENKPEGWDKDWCLAVKEVVWGYKASENIQDDID